MAGCCARCGDALGHPSPLPLSPLAGRGEKMNGGKPIMIDPPRPPKPEDAARWRAKGWWKDQTFSQLLEARAAQTPDREALADARRRISYGQLWAEVRRFAEFLRRQGVQGGDGG